MELTRRDAVAALAAVGAGGAAAVGVRRRGRPDGAVDAGADAADDETVRETLVAAAEVVYPSNVTGVEAFVEAFLDGRLAGERHAAGLREAVADLDRRAAAWYGDAFAALPAADRDSLLGEVGADAAAEDPDGTTAERVRYYVVNDLLLALYASPAGGELVGIENPQGHPGGTDTYQRGPSP
ncbi:gluconate 2-dehydrogenase subunit 3 family protein [Salinilacihabitans rarus]|uniref:gluconate 2-dehydrogenase subunit 3 family protein n=1 Tax=Salinilacihabitans rarus TaxID=2961596 RepID=UPI0020C861DF|nr:gluconate 2-dehydrogenase subunit 3 family protein [Salinilacihabitans rarus]